MESPVYPPIVNHVNSDRCYTSGHPPTAMLITHVTAHNLRRDNNADAQLSLRQKPLAIDEPEERLLDQLKNCFLGRLNREHGSFNMEGESENSMLAATLRTFLADGQDFTQATIAIMEQMQQLANETGMEINAHCLFFVEQSEDHHHVFYLFIVHQNESLAISDQLDVMPSYTIDTGPSLACIKVDIIEWLIHKHYAYLTLSSPRGKPALCDVLEKLTGFNHGINKKAATKNFLDGVESFAKQLPDDKAREYRDQVVDYCMTQDEKDEPVNIEELAHTLGDIDRDGFVRELRSHHPGEKDELMVDRSSLRRFVKFAGRDKDLSLTFSTYHLHSRIEYDMESDTLTIKGVPKGLRTQLLAYLER